VKPGDLSDHLMRLIVDVQRAGVDRADQLREVEGDATGRARRRVVQAGEVRLPLRVYVNVGLQVVYINALEDDVAAQAQAEQAGDVNDDLHVVHGGEQLVGLVVVELDVVRLGGAYAPRHVEAADLCAHAVIFERVLDLQEDVAVEPPGADVVDPTQHEGQEQREGDPRYNQ